VYKWVLEKLMVVGSPVMGQHPIQGRVEIPLVALCYRKWDKLRPDGPPGPYTVLTFTYASIVLWKLAHSNA